ncbi:MAG TPA: hypothetical protein PK537_08185 [Candidatus Limiplasma sp.]|nr:hypothetical protein [Candidatus Limiplasma sp.]
MRKLLIPIVLLVLLVVLMSSSSIAIYTQTQTLRGQLYMRVFLFSGNERSTSYEFGLSGLALAPGESEEELYRFSLTNAQSNGNVCDYDMSVSIASSGMASATAAMPGLTFYLYNVSNESSGPIATISSGELSYSNLYFSADVSKTVEYKLTARWDDNGDSKTQTALAKSASKYPIKIIVTAQGTN